VGGATPPDQEGKCSLFIYRQLEKSVISYHVTEAAGRSGEPARSVQAGDLIPLRYLEQIAKEL